MYAINAIIQYMQNMYGLELMRNLKFNEAIQEFTSKIGEYKLLTKSVQENTSTLIKSFSWRD